MPHRFLLLAAAAMLLAAPAIATPASELSGAAVESPAQAPVSAEAFVKRAREPAAAAPAPTTGSGYVPRTAHDNSPYRFDMTQNGRRMTAEEFDAWMKARGIRVATGKPAGSQPAAAAPAAETAQACQPTATTRC